VAIFRCSRRAGLLDLPLLFVGGTARTFMWAANAAFLPALVDRKAFPRAVNWNVSVFYLSSIIGPANGGRNHHLDGQTSFRFPGRARLRNQCADVAGLLRVYQPGAPATHRRRQGTMTLQTLLTGFKFVLCQQNYFGDHLARHVRGAVGRRNGAAADLCQGHSCSSVRPDSIFVGGAADGFPALRVYFESPSAAAKSRARDVAGRDGLRAGHDWGSGFKRGFGFRSSCLFICGAVDMSALWCGTRWCNAHRRMTSAGASPPSTTLHQHVNELGGFESGTVAQSSGRRWATPLLPAR